MLLAAPNDHLTTLEGNKLWQVALLELWFDTHLGQPQRLIRAA
jgi:asparagine synthase (glutamine-hydrolysing)